MNLHRIILILLCFTLCGQAFAQDIDTELSSLTERLAVKIGAKDVKKVAVIDFSDLLGNSSELGKYIAEQMTVDFAMTNRNFSIMDRANLNRILAEHKLTAKGLIDPENAKKLGMFAGVDAIIIGTIIPKAENIALTAKIISVESSELVGADKASFKTDDNVKQLMAQAASSAVGGGSVGAGGSDDDAIKVAKSFGELRVELQALKIADGRRYVLSMNLTNQSPKKTIWVAVSARNNGVPLGTVTSPDGYEFVAAWDGVSGVPATLNQNGTFFKATQIKPGESVSASLKYFSMDERSPSLGQCKLQIELLTGYDFNANSNYGTCESHNLATKIPAE